MMSDVNAQGQDVQDETRDATCDPAPPGACAREASPERTSTAKLYAELKAAMLKDPVGVTLGAVANMIRLEQCVDRLERRIDSLQRGLAGHEHNASGEPLIAVSAALDAEVMDRPKMPSHWELLERMLVAAKMNQRIA